jgi:hypothetical protein
MTKSSFIRNKYLFLIAIFFSSVILGLLVWGKISLPYQNPWSVVGPLTEIKYNPVNNILRFLILVFLPSFVLLGIYVFFGEKFKNSFLTTQQKKRETRLPRLSLAGKKYLAALILFTTVIAFNIPNFHEWKSFDSFHEGESLGPAISYLNGQTPYKDFVFLHGVYQDPLRSVLAFELFGKSIGSVRTLDSLVKLLTFILLAYFLHKVYRGNYLFSFLSIVILLMLYLPISSKPLVLILQRDITTFIFLTTIVFLVEYFKKKEEDRKKLFLITLVFSFIPISAFGYSVDRGYYLSAAYLILWSILYFFVRSKSRLRLVFLLSTAAGLLGAFLTLGLMLRWEFREFFNYTFIVMPKYKELMDGLVFPINKPRFLVISLLVAANTFWLTYKLVQVHITSDKKIGKTLRNFFEKHLIEFCLLILSIFFLRSALGRAEEEHLAYSVFPTIMLSLYIFLNSFFSKIVLPSFQKVLPVLLTLVVTGVFLGGVYRIHKNNLITENFPLKIKDEQFVPENYKATINFLKENLNEGEEFFTMTNEASWYYFLDKPSPTRFSVVWFAMPSFYQKEIVEDLSSKNVKFILYTNSYQTTSIDGFSNEMRLPIIVDYLKENYTTYKSIDGNEIWIKRSYLDEKVKP